MTAKRMFHAKDPKIVLKEEIGSLDEMELFNNQILVAIYIRPEKSAGGIIYTDKARDEDKWQGKVGLVMKMGPSAFVGDDDWFKDVNVKVGDWVVFRHSDGWNLEVNGTACKVLNDISIKGKIPHPDFVW
jgi:co-chaperonin GroES (HSP10)